jgi:hypothetical protein
MFGFSFVCYSLSMTLANRFFGFKMRGTRYNRNALCVSPLFRHMTDVGVAFCQNRDLPSSRDRTGNCATLLPSKHAGRQYIDKIQFCTFIREKRLEKGLTQRELAEQLFVSESPVSKLEMAKSYPTSR